MAEVYTGMELKVSKKKKNKKKEKHPLMMHN